MDDIIQSDVWNQGIFDQTKGSRYGNLQEYIYRQSDSAKTEAKTEMCGKHS